MITYEDKLKVYDSSHFSSKSRNAVETIAYKVAWGATHPLQQLLQSIKHFILRIDKPTLAWNIFGVTLTWHPILCAWDCLIKCQSKQERSTSYKVKSLPPVIFHTIPVALSIPISSKGDCMAFNAASLALVFPTQKQAPQKIIVFYVHLMRTDHKI